MPLFPVHRLRGALLGSLDAGAAVARAPGFSAPDFLEWLERTHATWYIAVPTLQPRILNRARAQGWHTRKTALRFVRSCSAPLPPSWMAELEDLCETPVIEAYGMTEASHQITTHPLPPRQRKAGSVDLPAGTEVAVTDAQGSSLPPGVPGEVIIRRRTLMRGYARNPHRGQRPGVYQWLAADRRSGLLGRTRLVLPHRPG